MNNFSEKVSFIWSVADLLRGDYKQSEYGRVILPFLLRARNLNELADKNAQPLITGTKVKDQRLPVPPIPEQEAIGQHIGDWLASEHAAVQGLGHQVERLQEYRQALITAAVTGQLDIGEEAAT